MTIRDLCVHLRLHNRADAAQRVEAVMHKEYQGQFVALQHNEPTYSQLMLLLAGLGSFRRSMYMPDDTYWDQVIKDLQGS